MCHSKYYHGGPKALKMIQSFAEGFWLWFSFLLQFFKVNCKGKSKYKYTLRYYEHLLLLSLTPSKYY